jgi:hypothetical protein
VNKVEFSYAWAMPNKNTFDIKPIRDLVYKYVNKSKVSVDPFARDSCIANYTNDLNPNTSALYHMQAEDFLNHLKERQVQADLLIFDPPYSPRQISDCYKDVGLKVGMIDTQSSVLYKSVRDAAMSVLTKDAIVISCGWNSVGMGFKRGFEKKEILLVCHGGAHNDTIITVEQRINDDETC